MFGSMFGGDTELRNAFEENGRDVLAWIATITQVLIENRLATQEQLDKLQQRHLANVDQFVASQKCNRYQELREKYPMLPEERPE